MEKFKFTDEIIQGFKKPSKQRLIKWLPIGLILSLMSLFGFLWLTGFVFDQRAIFIIFACWVAFGIVVSIFTIWSTNLFNEMRETYTIFLSDNHIVRKQNGSRDVEINRNEVFRIIESEGGLLVVKNRMSRIHVGKKLKDFEVIKAQLSGWAEIKPFHLEFRDILWISIVSFGFVFANEVGTFTDNIELIFLGQIVAIAILFGIFYLHYRIGNLHRSQKDLFGILMLIPLFGRIYLLMRDLLF